MQDMFKGYLAILKGSERLNLAYGNVCSFCSTPLFSKPNGENGESKNYFIGFENAKNFQNLILFGLM